MKSITVLKLKLESGDGLQEVAELCRRGRNAASENWLLRQRGLPETEAQARVKDDTKMYYAVRAVVPELHTQIASTLGREVNSFLCTKLDWRRRDGTLVKRRDAVLNYEDRVPYFTSLVIPILTKTTKFQFREVPELTCNLVRGQPRFKVKLSTKKLTLGHKRILRDLATGARTLADSKMIYRREAWYWYVPVEFETDQLNPDVEATLLPILPEREQVQRKRPFELQLPDRRPWGVGDGNYLLSQEERHIALRKQIGWRYKHGNGTGHGRKKIDQKMRLCHKQIQDIRDEVRKRMIADVVRQCKRAGVGTLIYREPTGPVKTKCWFEVAGISWDWTAFLANLKNNCARHGIAVVKKQLKMAEVKAKVAG